MSKQDHIREVNTLILAGTQDILLTGLESDEGSSRGKFGKMLSALNVMAQELLKKIGE